MTIRFRRCSTPLHKLSLEKVDVGLVCRQLQDLENDVGACLTEASGAGIGGPADLLGYHNQAGEVGDQVPGNL